MASKITESRKIFATNVKKMRKITNMTQEELARKTGLTPSYISDIERSVSNISLDNMHAIADAFGLSLYAMLVSDKEN